MSVKKKPYMAWWALPFIFQESNGNRPIRILMMGSHKPSNLGYPTRPTIVFAREGDDNQAIPFNGADITKLASGIILCSSVESPLKSADIMLNMAAKRDRVYRDFDFNKMEIMDAMRLAAEYGENWDVPYNTAVDDIRLLKNACTYNVLKGHSVAVHNLICIGKDIRHNVPIIFFKKSWNNFSDIMWLWDGGVRFLAGLMFLVKFPPEKSRYAFMSEREMMTGIQTWTRRLTNASFSTMNPSDDIIKIAGDVGCDTR